jgi:hypothetical protein
MDCVETRTPGTSVKLFFGPVLYLPRYIVGSSSLARWRGVAEALERVGREDMFTRLGNE